MRYDEKPIYRRLIVPWYDSVTACLLVVLLMALVFLFSLSGISVAGESVEHRAKIWLPVVLLIMSAGVIVSTTVRLFKRLRYRLSEDINV